MIRSAAAIISAGVSAATASRLRLTPAEISVVTIITGATVTLIVTRLQKMGRQNDDILERYAADRLAALEVENDRLRDELLDQVRDMRDNP